MRCEFRPTFHFSMLKITYNLLFTISLLFTDGVNVVRFVDCLQETGRRFQKPAPHSQPPDTTRNNELRTKDELLRTGSFGSVLSFNLITPVPSHHWKHNVLSDDYVLRRSTKCRSWLDTCAADYCLFVAWDSENTEQDKSRTVKGLLRYWSAPATSHLVRGKCSQNTMSNRPVPLSRTPPL